MGLHCGDFKGYNSMMFTFPNIDPVLFSFGFIQIRWYSLAYIFGFVIGLWLVKRLLKQYDTPPYTKEQLDDALVWIALGGIIGGRLFYVFVYNPSLWRDFYKVWEGGMAFHGGILGAFIGILLYARKNKTSLASLLDLTSVVAPLGILFGRLANFINSELWGRVTTHPLGMVFPNGGSLPRHPSQLYQAGLEGLLLLIILLVVAHKGGLKKPMLMSGLFATGYGFFRFIGEFFREPDAQLGFLWGGATMGQLLSIPVFILGLVLVRRATR
jgi:phosphatidylglycerol---prolipoprotein diacylglyceryl transferase